MGAFNHSDDRTARALAAAADLRDRLREEHAAGAHGPEPETVNRFCPDCAVNFGPDAEPDEPGDVGALIGGYRWTAAVVGPNPGRQAGATWCGCESSWCDHHGGNARTRRPDEYPDCRPCSGAPTGRYAMDFIGDVCAQCAAVPENGDVTFDHETGVYLATARRLDAR